MKPVDDELITHIKESLSLHEEAYAAGAWENFNEKQKRKGGLIWLVRLGAAAAVLLIGFTIFYMNSSTDVVLRPSTAAIKPYTSGTVTTNKVPDVTSIPTHGMLPSDHKQIRKLASKAASDVAISISKPMTQAKTNTMVTGLVHSNEVASPNEGSKSQADFGKPIDVVVAPKESAMVKVPVPQVQKQSFEDFLNSETEKNKNQPAKSSLASNADSKWDLGLMVAPSIGNDKKINMGYGVSMEYAVSKKVSISSGLSYNQIGASKTINPASGVMNAPAAATAIVQETKRLKSVDANLVGLDIPLELKYHFNDRFYTNVGVSAFAVLNQKQNNNYIEGRLETPSASVAGYSAFKTVFTESSVSEPVPADEIRNDKYLGFYNLSIGYKQKISGKNSLSIEPFMKLPIKEYSKENLHLIGTGIRLKFDF